MSQLLDVLRLIKTAQPDHFIMDRLVETSEAMPEQTVECLRLMIEGNKEYWKLYGWRDEMRKILGTAIHGRNPVARDKAVELVHRLGAMGYFEYRDLAPQNPKLKTRELYRLLKETGFDFVPSGTHDLPEVYALVKAKYENLCDDAYTCAQNCKGGAPEPEWHHVMRSALASMVRSARGLGRASHSGHGWIGHC